MTLHEDFKITMHKRIRKSKIEIFETITKFIESDNSLTFNKSAMKNDPWNLDPRTVDEFMHLAYYCQNYFPRIRIQEKNGKVLFQHFDYQELKKELSEVSVRTTSSSEFSIDPFNPKIFPVFKCRECNLELGYPSHCNEPMNHIKSKNKLICAFRNCKFIQEVPEHHNRKMEIFVKYSNPENIKELKNEKGNLVNITL